MAGAEQAIPPGRIHVSLVYKYMHLLSKSIYYKDRQNTCKSAVEISVIIVSFMIL